MNNADQDNRDPNLFGNKVETEKGASVEPKTATFEKPNQDDNKNNKKEASSKRKPFGGVIDTADFGKTSFV